MLVSLAAIIGWLILLSRSGELRRSSGQRLVTLAGIWAGIFAIVILLVELLRT